MHFQTICVSHLVLLRAAVLRSNECGGAIRLLPRNDGAEELRGDSAVRPHRQSCSRCCRLVASFRSQKVKHLSISVTFLQILFVGKKAHNSLMDCKVQMIEINRIISIFYHLRRSQSRCRGLNSLKQRHPAL